MAHPHKITVNETVVVRPLNAPLIATVYLTGVDCVMPRYPTSGCFFFNPPSMELSDVFVQLQSTLQIMLTRHPELSGTLVNLPDGSLAVECDDQRGVEFSLAEANFPLARLGELKFDQRTLPEGMIQANAMQKLMTVQLTQLSDKSLILGISISHSLFDGCGYFHFVQQWAKLTRGDLMAVEPSNRLSHMSRFNGRNTVPLTCPLEYRINDKLQSTAAADFQMPSMTSANLTMSIDKLRQFKNSLNIADLSVNDILCATIWRAVVKARQTGLDQHVKLGMAVDGRHRMNPPLPSQYLGNVNYWVVVEAEVKSLLDGSIAEAAQLIRAKVRQVDHQHIDTVNQWIDQQPDKGAIQPGFQQFLGPDFAVTSWAKFPIYETDFGWGPPVRFRVPVREFDGLALVFPTPDNSGNLEVTVGMKRDQMESFLNDENVQMFQT